jgi:ATP-dependent protease ClpP protease subunit
MAAPEAERYGLIDSVVETRETAVDEIIRPVGVNR